MIGGIICLHIRRLFRIDMECIIGNTEYFRMSFLLCGLKACCHQMHINHNNLLLKVNDLTSSSYYFVNRLNAKLRELQKQVSGKKPVMEDSLIQEINRIKAYLKYSYEVRSHLKVLLVYLTSGITANNAEEVKVAIKRNNDMVFSYTIKQLENVIDDVVISLVNVSKLDLQKKANLIKDDIVEIRYITRDGYNDSISQNIVETIDAFADIDSKGKTFYISDGVLYI